MKIASVPLMPLDEEDEAGTTGAAVVVAVEVTGEIGTPGENGLVLSGRTDAADDPALPAASAAAGSGPSPPINASASTVRSERSLLTSSPHPNPSATRPTA